MDISFNSVISKYTEHSLGLQWKCHIFCLKNTSTFTQHRAQRGTVKQIGTVGLCWTLLLVTIYHFFIGQKWVTSVSTWLSFHTKHLNRDSLPLSVVPSWLFKPTCFLYIKPKKDFVPKSVFLRNFDDRTQCRRSFNVYVFLKRICLWSVVF